MAATAAPPMPPTPGVPKCSCGCPCRSRNTSCRHHHHRRRRRKRRRAAHRRWTAPSSRRTVFSRHWLRLGAGNHQHRRRRRCSSSTATPRRDPRTELRVTKPPNRSDRSLLSHSRETVSRAYREPTCRGSSGAGDKPLDRSNEPTARIGGNRTIEDLPRQFPRTVTAEERDPDRSIDRSMAPKRTADRHTFVRERAAKFLFSYGTFRHGRMLRSEIGIPGKKAFEVALGERDFSFFFSPSVLNAVIML